jgi:hypothetical protein
LALRVCRPAVLLAAAAILCLSVLFPFQPQAAWAGDGTCGEASADASATWYFAEGYTGPGFQEWLTVFNPQETQVRLDLHLLYNGGSPRTVPTDLAARSRATLNINALAGADAEVSLYLESPQPVVVERPMYFTYRGAWKGCTVTSGATALSKTWYFAEGCTRAGFEEWLLLANPADAGVAATVHFVLEDGSAVPVTVDLPPRSRRTVFVNGAVGSDRDVGARVEADAPICAERVMYFSYYGLWPGGHASSGLSQPRDTYLFAEGYTGGGFQEWLTLYAPRQSSGDNGTEVTLDCLFQGGEEQTFKIHLDPDKRHTLCINDMVGEGKDVSMQLSADEPFLAERPMYFNYLGVCRGGHVSKGVEAAGTHWYLAEGTLHQGFHTYLCLMNPGKEAATVTIMTVCIAEELSHQYIIPPRSRLTLRAEGSIWYYSDLSFEITSDLPVAVERPLYYPGTAFEVANAMDTIWDLSVGIGQRVEGTQGELAAAQ